MARFVTRWRLTVLLVILCLASGWSLLAQLRGQPNMYDLTSHYIQTMANGVAGGKENARIPGRSAPPPSTTIALRPSASWQIAALPTLRETVERPLFRASRRAPLAAPEEAAATLPELKLTLIGIVVANEQRTAILRLDGPSASRNRPQILRLIPGNDYLGWRLEEVGDDRVRFTGDGKTLEFVLEFEKPAPPPRRANKTRSPRKISPAKPRPTGRTPKTKQD